MRRRTTVGSTCRFGRRWRGSGGRRSRLGRIEHGLQTDPSTIAGGRETLPVLIALTLQVGPVLVDSGFSRSVECVGEAEAYRGSRLGTPRPTIRPMVRLDAYDKLYS
jgi:hypothetical protein